jgi:hypothetical protein
MATDRLPNHTQMETLNGHLSTIASKISDPYSSQHKLASDLVDDTNQTNKFATAAELEQIAENKNNISYNANNGVKNIVNNTAAASTENAGITWAKNADGSMTGTGTCTGTSGVRVAGTQGVHNYDAAIPIPRGTYVIAPTGSSRVNEQFFLYLWTNSSAEPTTITVTQTEYILAIDNDTTRYDLSVRFSGTGVHMDMTLYPMICLKSLYDADPTYQPYALSNAELTAAIKALQAQLANQ